MAGHSSLAAVLGSVLIVAGCRGTTGLGARGDSSQAPRISAAPSISSAPSTGAPRELDAQTAQDQRLLTPPPDLAPVGPKSGVYSDPITAFTLTASDRDSSCADLTFSATGLPAGLAVTNNGDCTATVSGTIGSAAGTYPVIYKVTDEAGNSDSEVSAILSLAARSS